MAATKRTQKCRDCGKVKPLDAYTFSKAANRPYTACRECCAILRKTGKRVGETKAAAAAKKTTTKKTVAKKIAARTKK